MGLFDNNRLIELVTNYIKTQLELIKLDIQEKLEDLLSRLFKFMLASFAIVITLIFLLLGMANFLNSYLQSSYLGYFSVAGVLFLISLLIIYSMKIPEKNESKTAEEIDITE